MTTVATVVERCRRRLYAQGRGRYNFLNGALTTTATTLTLTDEMQEVQPGGILGIDTETLLVRPPVDKDAKSVPVARGFLGTTKAAHVDGSQVEIAPRFPVADIVDTIADELNSWGPQLFAVQKTTISAVRGIRSYNITSAVGFLYGLALEEDPTGIYSLNDNARSSKPYRVVRDQPIGSFASTFALQLTHDPATSVSLVFSWAQQFQTASLALASDLEVDIGLRPSMIDLLVIGVCWRLMSTREITRTDLHASGETARATDVPAGFSASTARQLLMIRSQRMADEANGLRALYPYRVA